jgi:hypothetical protein
MFASKGGTCPLWSETMKYLVLSALGAAVLSGCTDGSLCDTGDSSCKGGGDTDTTGGNTGTPLIQAAQGDCALGECVWTVEADADIGTVALSLVETGAPEFEAGCEGEVESGALACGVWSEFHNNFELVDDNNDYGGDTKTLHLDIVDDYTQVDQNQTTIFDFDSGSISAQTSVMWVITDTSGNYADCATYGHNPDYFNDHCGNNWEE